MVWLKFDKTFFFQIENDIYLAGVYVAPESSPIHDIYDIDIVRQIENDINIYKDKGTVYLTGDTNSRIGRKKDFIDNDRSLDDDDVYDIDTPLPRVTSDFTSNRFGDCLLDLCKSTNIRIVNGRLYHDKNVGKITCMTYNGMSTVDYLLTSQENFNQLSDFEVLDFNCFSNHAPITFSFKTMTNLLYTKSTKRTYYRWDDK